MFLDGPFVARQSRSDGEYGTPLLATRVHVVAAKAGARRLDAKFEQCMPDNGIDVEALKEERDYPPRDWKWKQKGVLVKIMDTYGE
ncbi:predicted protein [Lichtheimia corymbifera JMRC:FSU:9682]|uniref:Uncharacterized protein n=1 Tax=Lichtheimia corymbifera JMRC:FSU:9682 TaxID=1263082 RepID=A0A068SFP8_9FUNG|nr:predicted protein [Lichtheimia corymbifera JMRC:FSU:9682]